MLITKYDTFKIIHIDQSLGDVDFLCQDNNGNEYDKDFKIG